MKRSGSSIAVNIRRSHGLMSRAVVVTFACTWGRLHGRGDSILQIR